jgi:hypothetical protein
LNEETKNQVVQQLDQLRSEVSQQLGQDPSSHDPVAAHVEQVRGLVQDRPADARAAQLAAGKLEQRLLAWEADHPQLVSLAARLVRALEDAGL